MPDLRDYDLLRTPGEPIEALPRKRSPGLWIAVGGLAVAAGVAAYVVFGPRRQTPPPAKTEAPAVAMSEALVRPLGGEAAPILVPPLDESDPLVRELVKQITSHPRVAAWLTTRGLIRNFVLDVSMIADGKTPAGQLKVLRPPAGFRVIDRGGRLYIDPRSFERYDGLAAAAASIDTAAAARLYATLKPRIEEAYRDLGMPDTPFDRTLERALVRLIGTPIADDPIEVYKASDVVYRFAAPKFEELSAAQKQLLRTGPRNARSIQASLRNIALALGIPAERLPL
jgi:hypothetical protein